MTLDIRVTDITLDAVDPDRLAQFWGQLLGLATADRFGPYLNLEPLPGGITFGFQRVPETKAGKVRMHLDLRVSDLAAAVTRVRELGGQHLHDVEELGHRWAVVADPEGHEFCLLG